MSIPVLWDNNKLEPVLITYNRADHLEKTLQTFFDAGLSTVRLHVLDNASTDRSPDVVQKFRRRWDNLIYHRNKYNIGGNANILRAAEIPDSEYSWIIGDDDEWHLDDLGELLTVLKSGKADIIRLGWLASDSGRGKTISGMELALNEKLFFASVSMISATIIRRSIVCSHLPQAYQNTGDAYPQLVAIMRALQEAPVKVFTLSADLMTHTPNAAPGYYFGDLEWYSAWFRSSRFLNDRRLRSKFNSEVSDYFKRRKPSFLKGLDWYIKVALNYKALGINQWPYLFSMLAYGNGWRGRILLVMLAYAILPESVARQLRKLYLKSKNRQDRALKPDHSRL